MTDEPTRYARSQETARQKARHETIVRKLSRSVVDAYAEAIEETRPACVTAGLPSRWTDWASDPEDREDYEGEPPTKAEAEELCKDCPLLEWKQDGNVCLKYAKATGQFHGVWGGERRENGKWMDGKSRATGTIGGSNNE